MGFIVSQSIEEVNGLMHDSFYVRIENYNVSKILGLLSVSIGHYQNQESARSAFPDHLEDESYEFGRISVSMSYNDEWKEWPVFYSYPLTSSILVNKNIYSSSFHSETITYIDFDEEGNEITGSREEWIETVHTSSIQVSKTLKDLSLVTGSLYEYAYSELKNSYGQIFKPENIIDF
jgi:hypothetical protein